MVQEYIKYKQDKGKFQTLHPKIEKIILKNTFTIIGVVLLIIIILLILHPIVRLDVFLLPLESFGITVDPQDILLYGLLGVLAIIVFLLGGNYLVLRNVKYELYQDKLILYKNSFLFFIKSTEIPYSNIVKVLYNNDGIFNKIFNSGTVVLDLSGMKEDKIEMQFIDNVEENVKYIQEVIHKFQSLKQSEYTQNYRIARVLDEY